jgi:precorrin-6B methylase 2
LVLVVAVLLLAIPAWAQQETFEPQVGQAGKDVVWVPTPQELVDTMLDMANVTPQDFVMDLGSGDGRTVITAARRGARALGIEYNPDMVALSQRNAAAADMNARAEFRNADLFETDLSQAQVITMFLLPSINLQLRPLLLELRPGTRIVSNTFDMDDWEADERRTLTENCTSWCTALLWIVPARVAGTWQVGQTPLVLEQRFQMLSGSLGGNPISDARMRGDVMTFTAGGATYSGRVNGDRIQGTVTGGSGGTFTATR